MSEEYELIAHLIAATEAGDVKWGKYPMFEIRASIHGCTIRVEPDGGIHLDSDQLTVHSEPLFEVAWRCADAREAKRRQGLLQDLLTYFRADKANANLPPVPNYP